MLSSVVALFLLHSLLVLQMLHLVEEGGDKIMVNETNCLGLHQPCVPISPSNLVAFVKNRVL